MNKNDYPMKLWYSKKMGRYITRKPAACQQCNQELQNGGVSVLSYFKKRVGIPPQYRFLCVPCSNDIEDKLVTGGGICQLRLVLLVDTVPKDAVYVYEKPPNMVGTSDKSVFDAAVKQLADEKTVDKTRLSRRKEGSWVEGADKPQIGLNEQEVHNPSSEDELTALKHLVTAEPILTEGKEQELLE